MVEWQEPVLSSSSTRGFIWGISPMIPGKSERHVTPNAVFNQWCLGSCWTLQRFKKFAQSLLASLKTSKLVGGFIPYKKYVSSNQSFVNSREKMLETTNQQTSANGGVIPDFRSVPLLMSRACIGFISSQVH